MYRVRVIAHWPRCSSLRHSPPCSPRTHRRIHRRSAPGQRLCAPRSGSPLGESGTTPLGKPAGFGQVHPGEATEAHFLERPAKPEQEDPTLGAALIDDKIEATAIGVAAGFFDRRDGPRTQSIELSGHFPAPQHLPQRATRIVAHVHGRLVNIGGKLSADFMSSVNMPNTGEHQQGGPLIRPSGAPSPREGRGEGRWGRHLPTCLLAYCLLAQHTAHSGNVAAAA